MNLRLAPVLVAVLVGVFWTVVALANGWWWLTLLWVLPVALWFGIAPDARRTVGLYLRGEDVDRHS